MDPLVPGRIFWGVYPGKRGEGKLRPMIVTTRRVDLRRTGQVFAVVCSTTFSEPLRPNEILLTTDPISFRLTKLKEPTVAVCDWTTSFPVADIHETAGLVPTHLLKEICRLAGITYTPER